MATRGSKKGTQGRDSVTQPLDEQEAAFRLSLEEAFSDPAIIEKLSNIIKTANKDLVDSVSSLHTEVTTLCTALADRDAQIAALQSDVQHLKDANDALEQHGRRHSLRINGVSNTQEDTTQAVVNIANDILKVDPPLDERDISVSHRLPTRRNAPVMNQIQLSWGLLAEPIEIGSSRSARTWRSTMKIKSSNYI